MAQRKKTTRKKAAKKKPAPKKKPATKKAAARKKAPRRPRKPKAPDYPGLGETPDPGVYKDVPDHIYHSWQAVSNSNLKPLDRSAQHAFHEFTSPKESAAMDMGNAIHAIVLEPDKLDQKFAIRPAGMERKTNVGKERYALWVQECEDEGRIILDKPDSFEVLQGVSKSVLNHELLLDLVSCPGLTEVSIVWEDPETGLLCRARMDRFCTPTKGKYAGYPGVIVDLKGLADASKRSFGNSVPNYAYDTQAASYRRGMAVLFPAQPPPPFLFACIEKSAPFAAAVYELDLVFQERGDLVYMERLRKWKECVETGIWPGYGTDVQTLEAPVWVEKQVEYSAQ